MKLSFALLALGAVVPSYLLYVVKAVEVTRAQGKPDSFTYTNPDEKPQHFNETCANSGPTFSASGTCSNDKACTCTCDKKTPTFIAYLGKCVEDTKVRGLFDKSPGFSVERYNGTINKDKLANPCPPQGLPTFDIKRRGSAKKLVLCKRNKEKDKESGITTCTVTDVSYLNESTNGTFVEEKGTNVFTIVMAGKDGKGYPSKLKWSKTGSESPLIGAIALINFSCNDRHRTPQYHVRLLIKISGSKQWYLPSVEEPTTRSRSTSDTRFTAATTTQSTAAITRSPISTTETAVTTTPSTDTVTEHSKTIKPTATSAQYLATTTTAVVLPLLPTTPSLVTISESETTTIGTDVTSIYSSIPTNTEHSVTTTEPTTTDTTSPVTVTTQPTDNTINDVVTSTTKAPTAGTQESRAAGDGSSVTIALSVVGGLSFAIAICVSVFLLMRRRRKSERDAAKKGREQNSINPIYEKGADTIMMSGNMNAAYREEDSTYQPIVQNTRAASDQPTYETLQRETQRQPAEDPSIYQALETKPQEIEHEGHYQPLFKQSRILHEPAKEDTEPDYIVLEDPSDAIDGAGDPVYQVLEQGEGEGSPQENNTPDEPVYNVLEAE